jgi:Flp pilus assembly protein TadD
MNHRFDERPAMRPESGRCVRRLSRVATCLLAPGLALSASPVWAQQQDDVSEPVTVSRPVVQALPSSENSGTRDLDSALSRLARDPRNVTALIDAGNAALRIGDTEAALGFFSRADEVAPGNGRVKAQIASALLQGENPFDAIRYFDDAERSGADTTAMAGDRGLAYDLIGDNATAQRWYQLALSRGANDEVSRRYALSLAIAGDKRGAEAVLAPQVQRQDRGAWRVRTFIMAITGNQDEAVSIAYASMPQDLAAGISPYLRYMPRLTLAQQAAAANFGRFPRAADIGRDDPRVVQYAALHPRPSRSADAGLIPTGDALGGKVSREKRRRPGRGEDNTRLAVATPAPAMPVLPPPPASRFSTAPLRRAARSHRERPLRPRRLPRSCRHPHPFAWQSRLRLLLWLQRQPLRLRRFAARLLHPAPVSISPVFRAPHRRFRPRQLRSLFLRPSRLRLGRHRHRSR